MSRPPMTDDLARRCEDAIHIVASDGRVVARAGRAALMMIEDLGWPRFAALLRLRPFVWFVELGYKMVANHRPLFARFFFTREDEEMYAAIGADPYRALGSSLAVGVVRSLLFAWVVVWLSGWLRDRGVRLRL